MFFLWWHRGESAEPKLGRGTSFVVLMEVWHLWITSSGPQECASGARDLDPGEFCSKGILVLVTHHTTIARPENLQDRAALKDGGQFFHGEVGAFKFKGNAAQTEAILLKHRRARRCHCHWRIQAEGESVRATCKQWGKSFQKSELGNNVSYRKLKGSPSAPGCNVSSGLYTYIL